ncbi:MAG: hypothetical protein NTW50_04985 [Candidatus Berkelbacteria bacterium]|nr:hypothetical protein [Candidatus Berkelbacteria bacterium]
MKNHPEMMDMFLGQLDVGLIRDETSLEGWDKKNVGLILDHLIGIDNISHNVDQILLSLDPASIVNLFAKRIKRRLGMSIKTKSSSYDYVQYDAIPSYLSPELTKKLQDDPNFKAVLKLLIAEMHPNNPLYGMLLGELIKAVGGSAFREIQNEMISSGDDNQLKKVVDLMWGFGSSSVEFCFEIAKKTDNEKVLRSLESRFFSTGVVTGEYGIYSAYASKVEQIKKIMDENPDDKRVQKFGKRVIRDITLHMESEKKRVEESKILRQIEFES